MNKFNSLEQKCKAMGFSDLESLDRLAKREYKSLIENALSDQEKNGMQEELKDFDESIERVISRKVFDFITED